MAASIGRCPWANGSELEAAYHDEEWGVPERDEHRLFEFLVLEGAQAGLAWRTILAKRPAYRAAFADFDPDVVAGFGPLDEARLLADAGIVRNRAKIRSAIAIANARATVALRAEHGSLADHLWSFVGGRPIQHHWQSLSEVPATTPESEAMSRDLRRRGFGFVGPTICYALMQATGFVNDHLVSCPRHAACAALA